MSWIRFVLAAALLAGCGGGGGKIIDAAPPDDAGIDGMVIEEVDAGVDAAIGHPGTGTVTGAVKAASPRWKLYGTLRSGDGSSESTRFQRRGGITGATQP